MYEHDRPGPADPLLRRDVGAARRPHPYADLDITHDRIGRWAPLNQSLYVGYKVMLAGLLMISKGDRIAMHSSVETRYPFLDDDVIDFCSQIAPEYKLHGMTEKWILRQVAAQDPARRRSPTAPRRCSGPASRDVPRHARPAWVDQLLSPESLCGTRLLRPRGRGPRGAWQQADPPDHARRFVLRPRPDLRGLDPALAPPLLRRRPLRPPDLDGPRVRRESRYRPTTRLAKDRRTRGRRRGRLRLSCWLSSNASARPRCSFETRSWDRSNTVGLLVLLGVARGDTEVDGDWLVEKLLVLRAFADEAGKMNLDVKDVEGGILVVSQFTLVADCKKGRRPSFTRAGEPTIARELYEQFVRKLRQSSLRVETGIFGEDMQVQLSNDGPVTFLLDSTNSKPSAH